jgi:hypothetical protein
LKPLQKIKTVSKLGGLLNLSYLIKKVTMQQVTWERA